VSVLETIIGKKRPKLDSYETVLDLMQKFMIECKSQVTTGRCTPPQQAVLTMFTYGSLLYLAEANEVLEDECIHVLDAYLQRQGLSDKQALMEARIIVEQAKDPNMQWGIEIGYNSAMYWHKDNNADASKALARLLKTTR